MNVLIEVVLEGEMEWLQKEELEGFFVKASYLWGRGNYTARDF